MAAPYNEAVASWLAAVMEDERWFSDGDPDLGSAFTPAKTRRRSKIVVAIVERSARAAFRRGRISRGKQFDELATRLRSCLHGNRCRSLACVRCGRAMQRAKTSLFAAAVGFRNKKVTRRHLVMATAIPLDHALRVASLTYASFGNVAGDISQRLSAVGITRPLIGFIDLSFDGRICQPHLHAALWSTAPTKLTRKLKRAFPGDGRKKHQRPVHVAIARDLGFVGYMAKVVRWPDLLRRHRRALPDLLLALDRTAPADLILVQGFKIRRSRNGTYTLAREPNARPP